MVGLQKADGMFAAMESLREHTLSFQMVRHHFCDFLFVLANQNQRLCFSGHDEINGKRAVFGVEFGGA